jgi:hypothetical protein
VHSCCACVTLAKNWPSPRHDRRMRCEGWLLQSLSPSEAAGRVRAVAAGGTSASMTTSQPCVMSNSRPAAVPTASIVASGAQASAATGASRWPMGSRAPESEARKWRTPSEVATTQPAKSGLCASAVTEQSGDATVARNNAGDAASSSACSAYGRAL